MMNRKQSLLFVLAVVALVALTRWLAARHDKPYQQVGGFTFHTVYHITYAGSDDWHDSLRAVFGAVDASLSMFNPESVLARMNAGDTTARADEHFRRVFECGQRVSRLTDGAFDMTVAPMVNLWGFGLKNRTVVTSQQVDSLLPLVGWQKVTLDSLGRLHKAHPDIVLDASSIAKGYACDAAARFLEGKGIHDYMIEVGGEIALAGHNPKGDPWSVGINRPTDNESGGPETSAELADILHRTSGGIATSGNYRNYYWGADGRRYAHTIDPATGYPAQGDVLSATVIASDCMTADALATAFMVMGSRRALAVLEADTTLSACLIVATDDSTSYRIIKHNLPL